MNRRPLHLSWARRSGLDARPALAVCVLLAAAGVSAGASQPEAAIPAAPDAQPARTLDELIADLSSPDFDTRQIATDRLMTDSAITFADLEAVLQTRELPIEAHARLSLAARERFRQTPRGAMGVGFNLGSLRNRIVIDRTYAPFPCHQILEPGDVIVSADGVRLHGPMAQPTIQGLIVARDPGSVMKLVVRRGAEKLQLDVPLGRFADLENSNLDPDRLVRAWRTRSRDYLSPLEGPIEPPLHVGAWPNGGAGAMQQRQIELAKLRAQGTMPMMQVTAGGEQSSPRYSSDLALYAQQVRMLNGQRVNPFMQNGRAAAALLDFEGFDGGIVPTPEEELRDIEAQWLNFSSRLERARADLARARPGSAEARVMAEQVQNAENQQRVLTRLREAIMAEQAEAAEEARRAAGSAASVSDQD